MGIAAKVTGAGLGGNCIAFMSYQVFEEKFEILENELKELGFTVRVFEVTEDYSRVEGSVVDN